MDPNSPLRKFSYFCARLFAVSTNENDDVEYVGPTILTMTTETLQSLQDNNFLNEHQVTYLIRLLRYLFRGDEEFNQYTDAELRNNPIKLLFGINTDNHDNDTEYEEQWPPPPRYERLGGRKKRKTRRKPKRRRKTNRK